jgi:potassium-transporting ATPase KdpC subunit
MRRELVTSVLAVLVITVLFGLAYPLIVTGVAQVAFPGRADGSKVERAGEVVGSRLVGQEFRGTRYFHSRPSVTGYDPAATFFNNLGPNQKELRNLFAKNLAAYLQRERPYNPGLSAADVPVDAVTTSASGVDPHISEGNARIQARRVARVRRLPPALVQDLIADNTDGRALGFLGEPGVNVLELNLALDREAA